ncbi:LAGLIDADG family homing endonuclease [Candidatus Woesearchaeota archaeon]|nr:LAGLIDADG family homing endonuclease [Candidatus Woesearchaeota archaeon]
MIEFRLGDLNVYKDYESVCVQSSTTISAQLELLRMIFSKYSRVYIKECSGSFHFQVRLNKTFEFLLPKEDLIENWMLENDSHFIAFFAGYFDAEGNVQLYKNRLRLRVRSCDKNILYLAHQKLQNLGIRSIFRLELLAGIYKYKKLNKDFWGLSINRQDDIMRLIKLMLPDLKHANKRKSLAISENKT